jgi:Zn-dependent protease
MLPTRQGSFRLFRIAGIDLFLHWTWFLVAFYGISIRAKHYSSLAWPVLEYLTLFGIVLLHEFGHALACRQVGGKANQIVLWPLGGVAYVDPPPRPGATLWSIAAGPLVNAVLAPFLTIAAVFAPSLGLTDSMPNASVFITDVCVINFVLLAFNLLPIYPLDGGQLLRSVLWFFLGRARSLMVATVVGFVGVAILILISVLELQIWLGVMCLFILLNCWRGLMQARVLSRMAKLPRRSGFACPTCKQAPVLGPVWLCSNCRKAFDTFETHATCPHCGAQFPTTRCLDCGRTHPISEWAAAPEPPPLPGTPSVGGGQTKSPIG